MADVLGCTNPAAVNYDPSATKNDGSCVFLQKVGNNCYAFTEVTADLEDQSFTLSYSIESNSWVFYHDYIPDFYIGTRKKLYATKASKLYKTNAGPRGKFFNSTPHSFFIDIVYNYPQEVTLESIQWFTELIDNLGQIDEFATFTHITVWNGQQCTGRLAIVDYIPLGLFGERKTVSEFSFNELRDIVINRSGQFMTDIFANLVPIPEALDPTQPWYEKRFLQSNYFIVRLEYDNVVDKVLSLHSTDAIVTPTVR